MHSIWIKGRGLSIPALLLNIPFLLGFFLGSANSENTLLRKKNLRQSQASSSRYFQSFAKVTGYLHTFPMKVVLIFSLNANGGK